MSKQDLNPIVPCALRKLHFARLSTVAQTKLHLVSKKEERNIICSAKHSKTVQITHNIVAVSKPFSTHLRTLMTIYIKNKKQNPENFPENGTVRVHTLVTYSLRKPDANVLPNSVVEEAPKD